MNKLKKLSGLLISFLLLFNACLNLKQPSNKIQFYTLEYESPRITNLEPLPFVIKLERFTVASIYNTNRIIYRDQSFKRDAYVYYKWRANPGDLVTQFLGRDLRDSALFKAVLTHNSRFESSYILEGSIDEFFEWDNEDTWNATLSLSITFMLADEPDISKRIIFQKTYHSTEACKQKHPKALAEAMSLAMAKVSKEIIIDIYDYIKDRK